MYGTSQPGTHSIASQKRERLPLPPKIFPMAERTALGSRLGIASGRVQEIGQFSCMEGT